MFPLESSDILSFIKQIGVNSIPSDMFDPYSISVRKAA